VYFYAFDADTELPYSPFGTMIFNAPGTTTAVTGIASSIISPSPCKGSDCSASRRTLLRREKPDVPVLVLLAADHRQDHPRIIGQGSGTYHGNVNNWHAASPSSVSCNRNYPRQAPIQWSLLFVQNCSPRQQDSVQ
jgi:hypothetical protein